MALNGCKRERKMRGLVSFSGGCYACVLQNNCVHYIAVGTRKDCSMVMLT
jgi:hypothetical protein